MQVSHDGDSWADPNGGTNKGFDAFSQKVASGCV